MRWRFTSLVALVLAGCPRAPAQQDQPRGVQLNGVQLTTWRGGDLTARGTAKKATLLADGFVAEDVAVVSAAGTELVAPRIEGTLDLSSMTAPGGLSVKTDAGCVGVTRDRVEYSGSTAVTSGPVAARGCGFEAEGSRVVYDVAQRRADVFGPVRMRIEADAK